MIRFEDLLDKVRSYSPDADLERMLIIPAGCGLFELTKP